MDNELQEIEQSYCNVEVKCSYCKKFIPADKPFKRKKCINCGKMLYSKDLLMYRISAIKIN